MANFEAVTACNGIKMKKGCKEYLQQFEFMGEDAVVAIDSEGHFLFNDYGCISIYRQQDGGDYTRADDAADEFYDGLRKFIPKGEALIIHGIGHEKCRFPLSAWWVKITPKKVTWGGELPQC